MGRIHIIFFVFSCLTFNLVAQSSSKLLLNASQKRIEVLFDSLSTQGVEMSDTLRYAYHFYDSSPGKLKRLTGELDTIQFEYNIQKKFTNLFYLELFQIASHTPASLLETDNEFRKIASRLNIDAYVLYEVGRINPREPLVSESGFTNWMTTLDDRQIFNTGKKLLDYKLYDRAEKVMIESLKRNINSDTAYFLLGRSQLEQDEYRDGIEYLKLAIKVNPLYVQALTQLGNVFFDNHYIEEALIYLNAAVQLDDSSDETLHTLALVQFKLEQYNQSYDNARIILKRNKRHVGAKYLKTMFKNEHIRQQRKLYPAK